LDFAGNMPADNRKCVTAQSLPPHSESCHTCPPDSILYFCMQAQPITPQYPKTTVQFTRPADGEI